MSEDTEDDRSNDTVSWADETGSIAALAERRGEDYAVYQPAEDSALLAGEVEADLTTRKPAAILDVGTGSGYVGLRLADVTDARVVGVDVNPIACRRARERGLETVVGDLIEPFDDGTFDVVVFNPPYLPRMEAATWDDWFDLAVTGGTNGRELIDRFLLSVGRVLTSHGVVYLLVSSLTGVEAVVDRAVEVGFSVVALADAPFPGETLTVLKLFQ